MRSKGLILIFWLGVSGVVFAGPVVQEGKQHTEHLKRARKKAEQDKAAYYKDIEQKIETHVKNQRTSEEFRQQGRKDANKLLYVRSLEFHDHDGDGMVDHGVSGESSALEREFAPDKVLSGKELKIYKYMEAHEFKNKDGVLIKHMQREMDKAKAQKAREIGSKYTQEVIVRDEAGNPISTFAEDSIRDLQQKIQENSEEALHFQRLKRLEKYQELKQKQKEERIKSAFEIQNNRAISSYKNLGADRAKNLQAFEEALTEYKKTHPECLKAEFNCYVGEDGVIRHERMSDTKKIASQVEDTQEYEAQTQVLLQKGGDAILKRLPGELEDMTPAQRRAIDEARQQYQKRREVIRQIIEKKRKQKLQKGKMVEVEESTGKKATPEAIQEMDKTSAFQDRSAAGAKGEIDPEKLKKFKGKSPLKFLDY